MLEDVTIVFRGSEPEGPPEMPPLQLENFIPVLDQGQMGEAPFRQTPPSDRYIVWQKKINLKQTMLRYYFLDSRKV